MYHHCNVFRSWIQSAEQFSIQIEITMIEPVYHLHADDIGKNLHVHHVTGGGIRISCDLHDQFIVMSMIMGKIAFSKNRSIRGIIPIGIMQSVRGVEMLLTAYGHWMSHGCFK